MLLINVFISAGIYTPIFLLLGLVGIGPGQADSDYFCIPPTLQACPPLRGIEWVEGQWLHLRTYHFWPTPSPTGDRIRSKVELIRYLGPSCDLSLFDFKQGILCYPAPKVLHSVGYPDARGAEPPKTHPLIYILPALALPGPKLGSPWKEEEEAFEAS